MKKRGRIVWVCVLLLILAASGYALRYYRAGEAALRALESDAVAVEKTDFGWRFDGPADDAALIFYPGAKVDEAAYAPLLHALAERGMDVLLVKMPLHLAVLDMNAADRIRASYDYASWYIGGHSLGGAVAANYAAAHDLSGVILLAAYPTKAVDEPMLILVGSEDGVVNRARLEQAPLYGTVETEEIVGGNHAGFGDYGAQPGDKDASISAEAQQAAAIDAVLNWLG